MPTLNIMENKPDKNNKKFLFQEVLLPIAAKRWKSSSIMEKKLGGETRK